MKLIYYPPAFLLSRLYAYSLKKKIMNTPDLVDKNQFSILLKTIKKQMFSPRRNNFLDLTKNLIAAYFITPGDLVIDVGSHIGRYTDYYASLVGEKGRVHSYEAHPQIFQKLKNRFKNSQQISPHNFAVSNQAENKIKMKLYPDDLHHECATVEESLMNSERMPGNTIVVLVPCQKLDCHIEEVPAGRCSFIKIDVEGHEHAVIDGALELIQKHNPLIIYEYGYEPTKFEPKTIEQLNTLGYISYDCKTLKPVYPNFISPVVTDLVAVPKSRFQEFERLCSLLK